MERGYKWESLKIRDSPLTTIKRSKMHGVCATCMQYTCSRKHNVCIHRYATCICRHATRLQELGNFGSEQSWQGWGRVRKWGEREKMVLLFCFRQLTEAQIRFSHKDYRITFFTTGSCPCQINNHHLTFIYHLSSHSPFPRARTSLGTASCPLRKGRGKKAGAACTEGGSWVGPFGFHESKAGAQQREEPRHQESSLPAV